VPIARPLIVPSVFIAWGMISLVARPAHTTVLLLVWLGSAAVGAAIGWCTTPTAQFRFNPARRSVSLAASRLPLARNLIIFTAKYSIGVATAIAPAWDMSLTMISIGISGLAAGYFGGWAARYIVAFNAARSSVAVPLAVPLAVSTRLSEPG
jgi:hypothetical protein